MPAGGVPVVSEEDWNVFGPSDQEEEYPGAGEVGEGLAAPQAPPEQVGSQEKEKLRIRTKKQSPQGLRARQTGTNAVRECILIPTTKVTTT